MKTMKLKLKPKPKMKTKDEAKVDANASKIALPVQIVTRSTGKKERYLMQNTRSKQYIVGQTEHNNPAYLENIKSLAKLITDKSITTKEEAKVWLQNLD